MSFSNMRNTLLLAWLISLTCWFFGCSYGLPNPQFAPNRLCRGDGRCNQLIVDANHSTFQDAKQALSFGLAWAFSLHPGRETAIAVFRAEGGGYFIQVLGVGNQDEVTMQIPTNVIVYGHTHVAGDKHGCSKTDRQLAYQVNQAYGRRVRFFAQHKYGKLTECEPLP